jgi:hypothetical protein
VRLWREHGGAAALAGYGLPTGEALAAHANLNARAREYKTAGAFPDATMDQLRVLAYLDLLNGVTARTRIARGEQWLDSGLDRGRLRLPSSTPLSPAWSGWMVQHRYGLSAASSMSRVRWSKATSRTCWTAVGVDLMVSTAIFAACSDGNP